MFYLIHSTSWARFSLFRKELNTFNNTGARMLDCIYHTILKIIWNRFYGMKTIRFCHICT